MLDFGFYNMDCMEGMKEFPDKYFDLAIVDPPYGIGYDTQAEKRGGKMFRGSAAPNKVYQASGWDTHRPTQNYFMELQRVSKNQIIWGGNYFSDMLKPSKGFVVWDKRVLDSMSNNFADCELAYINEELGVARMFRYIWAGMLQDNMKDKEFRIHPTQKPVALYTWLLHKYAKPGDIILDTHVGSASSLIACRETGHRYVGFEIDPDYYREAKKRLDDAENQQNIFDYL